MSVGELDHNSFFMRGTLYLIATDKDGNIKQVETARNLITNQGHDILLHGLFSGAGYTARYLGLGSSVSFQTADISLTDEISNAFKTTAGTTTRITMKFNQNASGTSECTMEATAEFEAAATVMQAGIFVHSNLTNNTNSIFAKATFASIALAINDKLTVRWVFTMHCTQSQA